ncbi:MAG: glucoamylase family protein [Ferruginibacter sp.]
MIRCMYLHFVMAVFLMASSGCKKGADTSPDPLPAVEKFNMISSAINDNTASVQYGVNLLPVIKLSFSAPVAHGTIGSGITLAKNGGEIAAFNASYQNGDSIVILQPASLLSPITKYVLEIKNSLTSLRNTSLSAGQSISFNTAIDSSDKFPVITDSDLLDKVQQQTFKYFWDFGHPVSGMARERNGSGDLVTTGGTGFGIMAIITAVNRGFITRPEGRDRILKIADFLTTNCTKYHGAFAHWLNGNTGATIPFSINDNGGDLVETAYLMQGLLTARQYFNNTTDATEVDLRGKINALWNGVEWNWYRQNNQDAIYWHWSPDKGWVINQQVSGWNEALIVYVLAASSPTTANKIPPAAYINGWARNGSMTNNKIFFGYKLPLGPDLGGPLFFAHYSFLGINPNGLNDVYADYATQVTNHTKINYEYSKANPRNWYGYSNLCWGLTASDVPNGYNANAPGANDIGVISPTGAISSMPYTPAESMNALHFFYYKLGDKLWGPYGFYDAFKLSDPWFADSFLAIDQGPIIVMIENYRSGLLWNLFTSCPEVKTGMKSLGFTAPYL